MKTRIKLFLATALVMVALAACNKMEEIPDNLIEGTYAGTLVWTGSHGRWNDG